MTVTNTNNSFVFYNITSQTLMADWDFNFELTADDEIGVYLNATQLTLGEDDDYTVSIDGTNGGTITLSDAIVDSLVAGDILYLAREIPYTRTSSYSTAEKFDPTDVDADMDRLTLQVQQVNDQYKGLVIKYPTNFDFGDETVDYITLPASIPENNFLKMGSVGWIAVTVGQNQDAATLEAELASANGGANMVAYTEESTVRQELDAINAYLAEGLPANGSAEDSGATDIGVFSSSLPNETNVQAWVTAIGAEGITEETAGTGKIGHKDSALFDFLNTVVPKAFLCATCGAIPSLADSYRITGIVNVGTGLYRVTFDFTMANTNYIVLSSNGVDTSGGDYHINYFNKTTTTFEFSVRNDANNLNDDTVKPSFVIFSTSDV